jgi:hypothetical protein
VATCVKRIDPLDRLELHEDKINTSITVPSYVADIAKVQIWCAWAEVLLGETRRRPAKGRSAHQNGAPVLGRGHSGSHTPSSTPAPSTARRILAVVL